LDVVVDQKLVWIVGEVEQLLLPHRAVENVVLDQFPVSLAHGFNNLKSANARLLAVETPGLIGLEFFRETAAVINAGDPPDLEKIRAVKILSRCGTLLATLSFPMVPQRVWVREESQELQASARESSARWGRHANGRVRRTKLCPAELRPVAEARARIAVGVARRRFAPEVFRQEGEKRTALVRPEAWK
jgi:hypothetical protein